MRHRWLLPFALLTLFGVGLSGCLTTSEWRGMKQSEIAAWQNLGFDGREAADLQRSGLQVRAVQAWVDEGFTTSEAILQWHQKGFPPDEAAAWSARGIFVKEADKWSRNRFTPDQAAAWIQGGFSLKQAIRNRSKGLRPEEGSG